MTPEFLCWALEVPCALKDFSDWKNPDKVERHLRAIRIYQTAVREDRVYDGIGIAPLPAGCIDASQVLGFRVSDVFEFLDDSLDVEAICQNCPANVMQQQYADASVGCFGLLPVTNVQVDPWMDSIPVGALDLREETEKVMQNKPELRLRVEELFPQTNPTWYGLWIPRSPSGQQRQVQAEVMKELGSLISTGEFTESWKLFAAALEVSIIADIQMEIQLMPAATRDDVYWNVPEHCQRCHGLTTADPATAVNRCQICGQHGSPEPQQRRFVKGKRPYWKIARFLGEQRAVTFVDDYVKSKGR